MRSLVSVSALRRKCGLDHRTQGCTVTVDVIQTLCNLTLESMKLTGNVQRCKHRHGVFIKGPRTFSRLGHAPVKVCRKGLDIFFVVVTANGVLVRE